MRPQRAVLLARVSTSGQHIEIQVTDLLREAERRGLEVVEVLEDVASGRLMERAGLERVLALVDQGAVEVVMVAELSRIGRSLAGVAAVIERLTQRGVALVSLRESIDLASPTGRLLAGILASVAQWEAEILAERTRAGLRAAKRRGSAVGNPPYGTRWGAPRCVDGASRRDLEAVAAEIATLRRALALKRHLGTWKDAAAALNTEGRLTRSRTHWGGSALSRACRNERVLSLLADGSA